MKYTSFKLSEKMTLENFFHCLFYKQQKREQGNALFARNDFPGAINLEIILSFSKTKKTKTEFGSELKPERKIQFFHFWHI